MLPATKAVPKEMLPIVDTPTIQYAVEECVQAGIDQIVMVIARGKESIRDHFTTGTRADVHAAARGDADLVARVTGPARWATYHYVYQDQPKGQADAVARAREYLEGEPFALLFPDDIILAERSCVAQMVDAFEACQRSVIALMEVPMADVPQYGVVAPAGSGNPFPLKGIVEKPLLSDAPSNLAIVGRYILSDTIFCHIDRLQPGTGGEYWIADALLSQVTAGEGVFGFRYDGERYDTGRPLGYLEANLAVAMGRPELRDALIARAEALFHRG
jgi:UTP--glucose-1-phosphate uridylyltransferase